MKQISIPGPYSKVRRKIVVGINSLVSASYPAYTNHIQLFYRLGRSYRDIDFVLYNPSRVGIDRMRNTAAESAMDIEASHLLFIDDDVIIPHPFDFLHKLLACKADVAAADVFIRGWPFEHMFFKYTDKSRIGLKAITRLKKPLGPTPYDAVGFSCCLIETALIKKLAKPYFISGLNNTEDIYFCVKATDAFPETKIVVDTSISCGHILWPEIICADNIKNYKSYYKKQFKPETEAELENRFRGKNYYNLMKGIVNEFNKNAT